MNTKRPARADGHRAYAPRGVRAPGRRVEGRDAERRPGAPAPRAAVTGRYAT